MQRPDFFIETCNRPVQLTKSVCIGALDYRFLRSHRALSHTCFINFRGRRSHVADLPLLAATLGKLLYPLPHSLGGETRQAGALDDKSSGWRELVCIGEGLDLLPYEIAVVGITPVEDPVILADSQDLGPVDSSVLDSYPPRKIGGILTMQGLEVVSFKCDQEKDRRHRQTTLSSQGDQATAPEAVDFMVKALNGRLRGCGIA